MKRFVVHYFRFSIFKTALIFNIWDVEVVVPVKVRPEDVAAKAVVPVAVATV